METFLEFLREVLMGVAREISACKKLYKDLIYQQKLEPSSDPQASVVSKLGGQEYK